ncbi:biosynthetic arginine decarboxylase [Rhabdochromatium marinum]|uniref:biosynthetic arginine decarboxylase n=1 Tax=Rhabdochromatium marinum TaxID=48729 RepID=UPI001906EC52|nr:biosynthetic arginine decarboxylase [Rhabdochromatium marinum]MBK1647936.1 arginine decarboxylase [Rhabdochromatium marinum]
MSAFGKAAIGDSIYAISRWGEGYFEIADTGHLTVRPDPRSATRIDLVELIERLREQGLSLPVLLRFDDILRDRVRRLHQAFAEAMARHTYSGRYRPVYPIKVNQQHSVVRALLAGGGLGLEAGSKPELLAVLALTPDDQSIVCNGYKDREYVRLALLGHRLGRRVFIVIEKPSELDLVIDEARRLDVEPLLGVRVRLAAAAAGNWQNSGGEKAKFGLSASQILALLERLQAQGILSWLRLLHAHLGSQIPNLQDIRTGVLELVQFYAELRAAGASLDTLDFGGGLGVDYEGTRTRAYCSVNYSLNQYADTLVSAVAECCRERQLPEPDLITESGRALSAHHAVLITDVVDREQAPGQEVPSQDPLDREHPALAELLANLAAAATEPPQEVHERAQELRAQVQQAFARGELSLRIRARAEELTAATHRALRPRLSHGNRRQRERLDSINAVLADKIFCNFSLFQSLPDIWAIEQIFPILPLQKLHEAPTTRAIVQDLTCDSDGCIGHYVDQDGVEASLPLHDFDPKTDPYLIGFFMVGAYQEILGDIHNLFGDTDAVNIELDPSSPDGYRLRDLERGDSTEELLRYVHFEPRALLSRYRQLLQRADLDTATREAFYLEFKVGLYGYTYLGRL